METKHLSYFKVENFKRFDSLEVNDIGQFNLIVGDNNVGKTSLLEALLFDDENYNSMLANFDNVLAHHHINSNHLSSDFVQLDFFTTISDRPIKYKFVFSTSTVERILEVKKRLRFSITEEEADTFSRKLKLYSDQHLIEFDNNGNKNLIFSSEKITGGYYPFMAFGDIYADWLVDIFSKFAISNQWLESFKSILRNFIPQLTSIEVSNAYSTKSVLIIREAGKDSSQPLSQYGDATIKLFRYLLELEYCINRRLMIDEIDAGIHYSKLKEYLKQSLLCAKNKNVQVFATTHSKECIEHYGQALEELGLQNKGRIIHIANTKSGIKAYTMKFPEFENAIEAGSEIR